MEFLLALSRGAELAIGIPVLVGVLIAFFLYRISQEMR